MNSNHEQDAAPAQPAAPQGVAYAELPGGWPARFRCDSCDGNGEVGDPISTGHFQPPERERCPDCDGRGWCGEEPAFSSDHMRDFADRTHALRASNGQAPAGALTAAAVFDELLGRPVIVEGAPMLEHGQVLYVAPQLTATAQAAPAATDPAYSEACSLATALFEKHYRQEPDYASGRVAWSLCDTTAGVISQIDNMVSGLARAPAAGAVAGPGWKLVSVVVPDEMWEAYKRPSGKSGDWSFAERYTALLAAAPTPAAQADSAQDEFISREQWVERAMRVYLIAGDTEDEARECAEYQWGELDMDDIPDPYFTAMEDIEGRGPAPQADSVLEDAALLHYALADGGNQSMNWQDVYDDWNGEGYFIDALRAAYKQDAARKQGGA